MEVHFARSDLASLGELKGEVLCLPFFSDERPMRGATGLIDWRLCGRISQLVVSGRMRGDMGEAVLMPARPRLHVERLLWLGAGAHADLSELRFREIVQGALSRLVKLRLRSGTLLLPGRVRDRFTAADAVDWFLEESVGYTDRLDEVTLLETEEGQRLMQPRVDRARRRALSDS